MSRGHHTPSADTVRLLVGLAAVTRVLRLNNRLTQLEVARRGRVNRNFVGAIEHVRANPTVTQIGQLAHGLGLPGAHELMKRAEDTAQRIAAGPGPASETPLAEATKHPPRWTREQIEDLYQAYLRTRSMTVVGRMYGLQIERVRQLFTGARLPRINRSWRSPAAPDRSSYLASRGIDAPELRERIPNNRRPRPRPPASAS